MGLNALHKQMTLKLLRVILTTQDVSPTAHLTATLEWGGHLSKSKTKLQIQPYPTWNCPSSSLSILANGTSNHPVAHKQLKS